MSQVTSDVEALVAIGRIEAKLDATLPEHQKKLEANTQFQQTAQSTFTEHTKILTSLTERVEVHDKRLNTIEADVRGRFTRNTVLIGIALTVVNIVIGIVGR